VQGFTILSIHRLLTVHIVVGLVLVGPLALKLGSVGWRFLRYYRNDADYVRAGPPKPLLRVVAPAVVIATIVVFASGIALLPLTPGRGSDLVLVHKLGFIVWFVLMTVHVLAYTAPAGRRCIDDFTGRGPAAVLATRPARLLLVGAGLVAGVILGVAGLGWGHLWAAWTAAARP